MKNIVYVALLVMSLFFVGCDSRKENVELYISIDHEVDNGKVFILGSSNLPKGTKVGVTLSNDRKSYKAQDFDIFIDGDGKFKSSLFSRNGSPLNGKYEAEVISYFNKNWQDDSIIEKLVNYRGDNIFDGDHIEVVYDFYVNN